MAKRKTTTKPAVESAPSDMVDWIDSTVITGERETSRTTFNGSVRNLALMRRAMSGTPYQACSLNATACAGQTLRLVMPETAAKSHNIRTRAVGKGKRATKYQDYLRGAKGYGVSRKSMQYAEAAEDVTEVMEHPVLDLLRRPDPDLQGRDWMWFQYFCREACGESYSWIGAGDDVGPLVLYTLYPQFAWPVIGQTSLIRAFRYGRNTADIIEIPAEDVIYIRQQPHPEIPWRGYSWLESVAGYSDVENAAIVAELARWKNGGNPSSVIEVAPETTDPQMRQLRAATRAQIAGVNKHGEMLFLRGAKMVLGGAKPHEMNYGPGMDMAEKRVYDAANIPESVYRLNSANLASAEVGNTQYMRHAIAPRISGFAEQLTDELLPRFGVMPGEMWFAYDDCVPEDVNAEATRLMGGLTAGAVRPNEYRMVLGLDPLDDALNVIRVNGVAQEGPEATMRNVMMDSQMRAMAAPTKEADATEETEQGENGDSGESESGGDDASAVSEDARKSVGDAGTLANKSGVCGCTTCVPAKQELAAKGLGGLPGPDELPAVMMIYARRMYEEVKAWYVRVYRMLIGIEPTAMAVTPAMVDELKTIIQYVGGQAARGGVVNVTNAPGFMEAFAAAHGQTQPGGFVTIDPKELAWDLPNTWAVDYAERRALELAKSVPDTIVANVRADIARAIEAGATTEELQRSLYLQVPDLVEYQARRLALTETAIAFNEGAKERIKEAGLMAEWSLDPTLDNCPQCVAIANDPRNKEFDPDVGATDPTTGMRISPPVHPNCGCMVLAAVPAFPAAPIPVNAEAMT
jgi:phage portal protein BeeE